MHRILAQTKAAQRRFEDDRTATEASKALAKIDELITEGDAETALSTLNEVVQKHGEFRAARLLRYRLESHLGRHESKPTVSRHPVKR